MSSPPLPCSHTQNIGPPCTATLKYNPTNLNEQSGLNARLLDSPYHWRDDTVLSVRAYYRAYIRGFVFPRID